MKLYLVYTMTNPEGKTYIGTTTSLARINEASLGKNSELYADIKEHGLDWFTYEVICGYEDEETAKSIQLSLLLDYDKDKLYNKKMPKPQDVSIPKTLKSQGLVIHCITDDTYYDTWQAFGDALGTTGQAPWNAYKQGRNYVLSKIHWKKYYFEVIKKDNMSDL